MPAYTERMISLGRMSRDKLIGEILTQDRIIAALLRARDPAPAAAVWTRPAKTSQGEKSKKSVTRP